MRTTVTLDDDVERLLRDAMRQTGQSFKQTLNEAVRRGMAGAVPLQQEPPFVVRARPMRLRAGIDPARLNQWSDALEVDAFLRVTSGLQKREEAARATPETTSRGSQ